jgi:hypothetical protein
LRAEFLFSRFSVLSGVFLSINFWINPALFQRQSRLLGECDLESPHVEEQRFPKEILFFALLAGAPLAAGAKPHFRASASLAPFPEAPEIPELRARTIVL